ncbi:MAG: hypothetical protein KF825_13895 [Ferruginibacter sp.]|nr:hypothetical protein [Ferruginibacter sp.]
MKTLHKLKLIIFILAGFCMVLNSCKKADNFKKPNTKNENLDLIKAHAYVKDKMKQIGGTPLIFPVHKKMEVGWGDSKNNISKIPINSGTYCTNYDLPDYVNFIQYQRIYVCDANNGAGGYFIQWEYELSWSKVVINDNGNVKTQGFIEILNNQTNTIDLTLTIDDAIITDLGPDPVYSPNHRYSIKFRMLKSSSHDGLATHFINGDITTTYTVKLGATFATSCPDSYALWILPASWFGFTGNTGLHPCDRTDYPIFLPPYIFGNQDRIGIVGYDPQFNCSNFGGSFIETDLQEVQYSLDAGLTWNLFPNVLGGGSTNNYILQFGYIRQFDFAESVVLSPGTYTVILRFRNWKYSNGIPNPLTTIPSLANGDCRSPENSSLPYQNQIEYSAWAYEVWPDIDIY